MKKQMDMINGSLVDKILLYTLPLALTGILQQLFNAADIAVVGRFVGKEAMAAIGSNSSLIALLVNFFVGISLGTTVTIAHAIGMKDSRGVQKAVHTSLCIAVTGGFIMMILGELFAPQILRLTSVPEEVFDMAVLYLRIYLLGMPVILLYNFESAIFRSRGNTKTPLIALMIAGIINVILNLFLVIQVGMTVDGVAVATVVSNSISSLFLFMMLIREKGDIHFSFSKLKIDGRTLKRILGIGIPSGIQSSMFSLANIIIQSTINSLGATVMAASSAAFNLEIFAYYVMNAFGQACTTFVGQNHGAGKIDRCKKVFIISLGLDAVFTAVTCFLILGFSHPLLAIFNPDPQVIAIGYVRLCYIFFAYIFSLMQEVGSGYLRGFGMSAVPAVITMLGVCGVRIVWSMTVFKRYPSFETVMLVYPISLGITGIGILIAILLVRPSRRFGTVKKEQEL